MLSQAVSKGQTKVLEKDSGASWKCQNVLWNMQSKGFSNLLEISSGSRLEVTYSA